MQLRFVRVKYEYSNILPSDSNLCNCKTTHHCHQTHPTLMLQFYTRSGSASFLIQASSCKHPTHSILGLTHWHCVERTWQKHQPRKKAIPTPATSEIQCKTNTIILLSFYHHIASAFQYSVFKSHSSTISIQHKKQVNTKENLCNTWSL
jgi:hypothetical protein